ncbi:MAG: iron ABC transporter permease [Chloroflexi bacterium]|nr:iron ABC transporter permease [Chloroflexota bacterium]
MLLLVGLVTVVPVGFVLVASFNDAGPTDIWAWGVQGWLSSFTSGRTLLAVGYSFLLALRAPFGALVGALFAWLLVRVKIPAAGLIEFGLWVAFFLPTLSVAVGWTLLLDPHYGLINQATLALPFVHRAVFNIYSVAGILWVHLTLTTIPVMVMLLAPALRQLDASFEEAATMSGAGRLQTLRRVVFPLIAPAVFTAVVAGFIRGLEAFEVEQFLGTPAGIQVYATRIYDLIGFSPPQFSQAMALSSVFLIILLGLAWTYQWKADSFAHATVLGRGARFTPVQAGRWRYLASGLLLAFLLIGVALPCAFLVLGSFMRLFGFFTIANPFSLAGWQAVLRTAGFAVALRNSVVLGTSVGILGVALYGLLAWVLARGRITGRRAVSILVWLPWAVPGILLGISLLWIFLAVPGLKLLYGSMGALVIGLLIQNMPFATQILRSAVGQVGLELEEAGRTSGAAWLRIYWRILLPIIAPTLVSVFVLIFVTSIRDISTTVLLSGASSQPLSILMLNYATSGNTSAASAVGVVLSLLAVGIAVIARARGLRLGVSA